MSLWLKTNIYTIINTILYIVCSPNKSNWPHDHASNKLATPTKFYDKNLKNELKIIHALSIAKSWREHWFEPMGNQS